MKMPILAKWWIAVPPMKVSSNLKLRKKYAQNFIPDILTDQTSAHDPLVGYIPENYSVETAAQFREADQKSYLAAAYQSMAHHVRGM